MSARLAFNDQVGVHLTREGQVIDPVIHLVCLVLIQRHTPTPRTTKCLYGGWACAKDGNVSLEKKVLTLILRNCDLQRLTFQERLEGRPPHPRFLRIPLEIVQVDELLVTNGLQLVRAGIWNGIAMKDLRQRLQQETLPSVRGPNKEEVRLFRAPLLERNDDAFLEDSIELIPSQRFLRKFVPQTRRGAEAPRRIAGVFEQPNKAARCSFLDVFAWSRRSKSAYP